MELNEGGKCLDKKVKRKPNFKEEENVCLSEGINNEKHILMSKFQNSVTNKKKREIWRELTAKVNSFGVALRSEEDLKKKWKDLKSAALNVVEN